MQLKKVLQMEEILSVVLKIGGEIQHGRKNVESV